MEHTPTPWKKSKNVLGEYSIHWGDTADRGTTVATARTEAAANKIVLCVNAHEVLREALVKIASFAEGEKVTSSFDEPHSAEIARTALKLAGVKP